MTREHTFLKELLHFSSPLAEAIQNTESLDTFVKIFGFELGDDIRAQVLDDIQISLIPISASFNRVEDSAEPALGDIVSLIASGLEAIEVITESNFLQTADGSDDDLVLEVFDFLSYQYLATRVYLAEAALSALGVITHELIETADSGGRQVDFVRAGFKWSRLADFVQSNEKWGYDVYGWAGHPNSGPAKQFDFVRAIRDAIGIVHASGLSLAHLREISDTTEIDFFLKNAGGEQIVEATLPFYQNDVNSFDDENNQPVFSNEAGIKLVPFGDMAKPEELGLAIAPYTKGSVSNTQQLSERLTLDIRMSGQAVGGAYLTITPNGIDLAGGEAVNAEFDFSTTYASSDQARILLAGDTQSTHVQTNAIVGAIGGNMSGDFYLSGGFKDLRIVVDTEEDGFLDALLSRPLAIDVGDVIIGWRAGRGVYFDGGTSLGLNIPLDLDLGAVSVRQVRIVLNMETGVSVSMLISMKARLGPIAASVESVGTSLVANRVQSGAGKLGKYDLSFGFRPPSAVGLSIDAHGIKGGGFLAIDPPNYAGALQLTFRDEVEVTAYGLIATELPDGRAGYSLVISILAEFQPIQLGLGFALTGVGGLIGIHRRMDEEALRETVKTHALDAILFPSRPITDAVKVLGALDTILPAKQGFHVFGPMGQLIWGGTVTLVEFEVGVFIELGGPVRIALLGQAKSELPDKKAPIVVLNMDLLGFIDFGKETVAIDSSLYNSKIQGLPITGQMALRANWGEEAGFALAIGGFHPRFEPPVGFPKLQRVALTLGDGNPRIALSGYLAITTNTLQFGALLELWAKKAGFTVTGGLGFDALFIFHPFSFEISAEAWVDVRRGRFTLLGVSLGLTLSGPNPFRAKGYAKIKICWFLKIKVRFDRKFGKKRKEIAPSVRPLEVLRGALGDDRNTKLELPAWASATLVFAEGSEGRLDRAGSWVFSQTAVPLNYPLERFGGGTVPEGERQLTVEVVEGESVLAAEVVEARFAPAQFHDWTAEEQLSAPAFERFESGVRLGGAWETAPASTHETVEIEFETILRESPAYLDSLAENDPKNHPVRHAGSWKPGPARVRAWAGPAHEAHAPRRQLRDATHPQFVEVTSPGYVLAGHQTVDGQFTTALAAPATSYAHALRSLRQTPDSELLIRPTALLAAEATP